MNPPQYLLGLTDHDMNDLEFALAQRKAMSRRCLRALGEHSCALAPPHGRAHVCRGCDTTWEDGDSDPQGTGGTA